MITTDNFYLSLSEEAKKYFFDAINKMGWIEHTDGFWGGGKSTKFPFAGGACKLGCPSETSTNVYLSYSETYSTERLYYRLQLDKEIPSDEELINESRNKKLNDIL